MTTPLLPKRLARRLAVCFGLLLALDLLIRGQVAAIDSVFLRHYRMPDVLVPPLAAYAAAIGRQRQRQPGRIYLGFAGPSFVYGTGVQEADTLPAQVQSRFDAAHENIVALNLALPGNRYDDDRIVARSFAGTLNAVLVPYSPGIAEWVVDSCPQHLDVLEWGDDSGAPFVLPPSCIQPERHLVNTWLDRRVSGFWAAYAHRAALRKLLFPAHGDFGRLLHDVIYRRLAKRPGHPAPVDGRPPALLRLGTVSAPKAPKEIAAQVDRLCTEYAAKGTHVLFYRFPQFERPDQPRRELELFQGLDAAIRARAATHPRCRLVELDANVSPDEYRDIGHPNEKGLARLADVISATLIDLKHSGGLGTDDP